MTTLDIRGGGAVAVDTETLRDVAAGFARAAGELTAAGERAGALQLMLGGLARRDGCAWEAERAAWALYDNIRGALDDAVAIAASLEAAAVIYDLVELDAARAAALLGADTAEVARIDALRAALLADHPDAAREAWLLAADRAIMWPSELVRQATETGLIVGVDFSLHTGIVTGSVFGVGAIALAATTGLSGSGLVGASDRLRGPAPAVRITPLATAPAAAPATLHDAASRIPSVGSAARVRVEKYTMPDGENQYAVYVAGTRDAGLGGADPWDLASNAQLYAGDVSASYEATMQALSAAGAAPGDVVHAFGFSQGAMITSHIAVEGAFDVRTHVALGSPVEAALGDGTLSVALRHTDDPIVALAGGGHIAPVGAPGSFVVETVADPGTGVGDLQMTAHRLPAYLDTAGLVDASADPRVQQLREVFTALGGAASVEVTEFAAQRP